MKLHIGIMLAIELNIDNNYFTSFKFRGKKYKLKKSIYYLSSLKYVLLAT